MIIVARENLSLLQDTYSQDLSIKCCLVGAAKGEYRGTPCHPLGSMNCFILEFSFATGL